MRLQNLRFDNCRVALSIDKRSLDKVHMLNLRPLFVKSNFIKKLLERSLYLKNNFYKRSKSNYLVEIEVIDEFNTI